MKLLFISLLFLSACSTKDSSTAPVGWATLRVDVKPHVVINPESEQGYVVNTSEFSAPGCRLTVFRDYNTVQYMELGTLAAWDSIYFDTGVEAPISSLLATHQ